MSLRTIAVRTVRISLISALTLVFIVFSLIQIQQRLLRHRAERLLIDFHSIRLNQSTWADAQTLITRWGAFGHYDGTCTSADCSYFINLGDQGSALDLSLYYFGEKHWPQRYSGKTFFTIYEALGGRPARMHVSFLVQDGHIHRSAVGVSVRVELKDTEEDSGYELGVSARANDHLSQNDPDERWIAGDNEQLSQHPEYKVGRPSGCEWCIFYYVTFTPNLPQSVLLRLTDYSLSCFTAWHGCIKPQDLLPAAEGWHLYPPVDSQWDTGPEVPIANCALPAFALARDAAVILAVNALSVEEKTGMKIASDYPEVHPVQIAHVKILRVIKGILADKVGDTLTVRPLNGDYDGPPYIAENLQAGKDYVLFFSNSERTPILRLERCGVLPDTEPLHQQIQKGLSRLDPLRRRDSFQSPLW